MCSCYPNTVNLESLFLSDTFADIHFRLDVSEIPAHKAILALKSPIFQKRLHGQINSYPIPGVGTSTFLEFLQFFYMNEVRLTATNIIGVIGLVQEYQLKDALAMCEQVMRESFCRDNALNFYNKALQLRLSSKLIEYLEEQICFDPLIILQQKTDVDMSPTAIRRLLGSNNWRLSEILILQVAVHLVCLKLRKNRPIDDNHNGIQANIVDNNLRQAFGDNLYLIGYPLMDHAGMYCIY